MTGGMIVIANFPFSSILVFRHRAAVHLLIPKFFLRVPSVGQSNKSAKVQRRLFISKGIAGTRQMRRQGLSLGCAGDFANSKRTGVVHYPLAWVNYRSG